MLKSEMYELLNRREIQLNDMTKKVRGLEADIKPLLDDSEKLAHYEKNNEQVAGLIDSLSAVLCPDSVSFQRQSYDIHRMAEQGQQLPERPQDQLFDILQEIKTRIMNSGLTNIRLL